MRDGVASRGWIEIRRQPRQESSKPSTTRPTFLFLRTLGRDPVCRDGQTVRIVHESAIGPSESTEDDLALRAPLEVSMRDVDDDLKAHPHA